MKTWRVAGIGFDHMHMGDHLRQVFEHPAAEIVGVCDADQSRMADAAAKFAIPAGRVFTSAEECLAKAKPDVAILCSTPARHADDVEVIAGHGVHVLVEKPFAAAVADCERMIAAAKCHGARLAVNWPSLWEAPIPAMQRHIAAGLIGEVREIHYYGGNRGPTYHLADGVPVSEAEARAAKATSWWYKAEEGGGSLLDYMGYGATLGAWFRDGELPLEVTCVTSRSEGVAADEHAIAICRYGNGLSKLESRWGTFTDPWTHQTQPRCGIVVVGSEGTIAHYDYDPHLTAQTRARPEAFALECAPLASPNRSAIEYMLHALETGQAFMGPLDPALSLRGQMILDAARRSAELGRSVKLAG